MSSSPEQLAAQVGLGFSLEGFRLKVLGYVTDESPQKQ